MHPYESGLVLFIRKKLENLVPIETIKEMLLRAGFSNSKIEEAIKEVRKNYSESHQDVAAANNFLPPLNKYKENIVALEHRAKDALNDSAKGLFAGRLRRRDFILSFILFFGIGASIISFTLGLLAFTFPDFVSFTRDLVDHGLYGFWMFLIPLSVFPITVMMFSLLFRRLHDISLSGKLAFGFLVFFINPINDVFNLYGIWALQGMMAVIFLLLLTKKGDQSKNQYGAPESIQGSMFSRIFNQH